MGDKTKQITKKFEMDIAQALSVSHDKIKRAQDELSHSLVEIHKKFDDRLRFEALTPQGKVDSVYHSMIAKLQKARVERDNTLSTARAKGDRFGILIAKEKFDRVTLFHELQDDQGQDFEQLHLQSGIDPSYDPDVYSP
jgi:hypothetical protein